MNRREVLTKLVGLAAVGVVAMSNVLLQGCAAAGALPWINMGLNLISTILPTIPGLIAAFSGLLGHNVLSAAQVAKLTAVFQGVQDLFTQAQSALTQYETNPDPTLIAKIQDILTQVKTRLSTIVADLQITNAAAVAKITLVVNSFIDLANNILAIIPQVINGKVVARKPSHAQLAQVSSSAWAGRFNRAVQTPTGSAEVDAAFANVRAVPVKN